MATLKQVETGALHFVKQNLVPIMPVWQGVLLGSLAQLGMENWIKMGCEHPLVKATNAVDNDNVDVDRLYNVLKENAAGKFPIPYENKMFSLSISEGDLDKLYRCIKEAQP